MTEQETWEKACERVGVRTGFRDCKDLQCIYGPHHHDGCPPLGDPAACMAMLASLAPRYAIVKQIGPNWQVNNGDWSESLPLALAAAVCALPSEMELMK